MVSDIVKSLLLISGLIDKFLKPIMLELIKSKEISLFMKILCWKFSGKFRYFETKSG